MHFFAQVRMILTENDSFKCPTVQDKSEITAMSLNSYSASEQLQQPV